MKLRIAAATALALTVVTGAACGGGKGASRPSDAAIAGSWEYLSGPFLQETALATTTWLQLDADGAGTVYGQSANNAINGCASLVFAVTPGNNLSFSAPTLYDFHGQNVFFYRWERAGNQLRLTDRDGQVSVFTRGDAVPAESVCGVASTTSGASLALTGARAPDDYDPSLVGEGDLLWYRDFAGDTVSLTAPTLATGATITWSFSVYPYYYPFTLQGGDFWMKTGAGRDDDAARYTTAETQVDVFNMQDAGIAFDMNIYVGEWDGTSLWLAGFGFATNDYELVRLNSDAEPDLLSSQRPLDGRPLGMAVLGTRLFVLTDFVGPVIVELDKGSGHAIGTWSLPTGRYYRGLAAANGSLWALSTDQNQDYLLQQVTGP